MAVLAPLAPATSVTPTALGWGVLSGTGTGLGMLFLYRGIGAGLWPVTAGRLTAVLVILPVAFSAGRPVRIGARRTLLAAGTGALAATALSLYLAATHEQARSGTPPDVNLRA